MHLRRARVVGRSFSAGAQPLAHVCTAGAAKKLGVGLRRSCRAGVWRHAFRAPLRGELSQYLKQQTKGAQTSARAPRRSEETRQGSRVGAFPWGLLLGNSRCWRRRRGRRRRGGVSAAGVGVDGPREPGRATRAPQPRARARFVRRSVEAP
jgi:hypothetical protein